MRISSKCPEKEESVRFIDYLTRNMLGPILHQSSSNHPCCLSIGSRPNSRRGAFNVCPLSIHRMWALGNAIGAPRTGGALIPPLIPSSKSGSGSAAAVFSPCFLSGSELQQQSSSQFNSHFNELKIQAKTKPGSHRNPRMLQPNTNRRVSALSLLPLGIFFRPSWMKNTAVPIDTRKYGIPTRQEIKIILTLSDKVPPPPLPRLPIVLAAGSGSNYHASVLQRPGRRKTLFCVPW
ncbi:hypothetical protein B0H67DRAFT_570726 [Lasiosphaeris hirsuta]|uniref:Uncharacterized protein n=1 Tax=Lasiosphaeris hirsuta TaxID=260670 RepID=A0AA40E680_9PEZI|nr:hypothetical protein B0H67DRAFT_570726 [Lasiosphaeris hirsuta]